MATDYQLWVLDAYGNRVAMLSNETILSLAYARTVNAVGPLNLKTIREAIPDQYVTADAQLEVWRKPDGGQFGRDGDGPWLVQTDTRGYSQQDGRYRTLRAVTLNHLLSRRVALFFANSAQTTKTGPADNVMKAIVRENLAQTANTGSPVSAGISSNPSRDWTSTGLAVDADFGLGPSISKGFAWQNVLTTLQAIARDAATQGTPVYFDITGVTGAVGFYTFVGTRGADRTTGDSQVIVSPERGSLGGTIEVTTDWTDAATHVTAGGQGQDAARILSWTYDTARIQASTWGLREYFLDQNQSNDINALLADARAELQRRRPQKVLTGDLISVPGAVYGRDWGFGDRLVAEVDGDRFNVRVNSVSVSLTDKGETIAAKLQSDTL